MADPALPSLTILGGPMAGRQFVIEETVDNILVGSDPSCRFHLPLPGVSPIHCRLWVDAEGVTVYDANSPRGLYVNDDRVTGQSPIRNGDILWLGAPGDPDVVMIQCRVPKRPGSKAAPTPPSADELPVEETVALGTRSPVKDLPTASEGFEVVPETPSEFEVVPEEPQATEVYEAVHDEPPPTAVFTPPAAPPPTDDFEVEQTAILASPDEADYAAAIGAPPAPEPPPAPPAPHVEEAAAFEDETAVMPPPAPAPPPPAPEPEREAPTRLVSKPAPPPEPKPAPKPRPSEPARVAPAQRPVYEPVPPPTPRAAAKPPQSSSATGVIIAIVVLGIAVLAGAGFLAWQYLKPKGTPVAQATPPPPSPPPGKPPVTAAPATAPPNTEPPPPPVTEAPPPVTQPPATQPPPTPAPGKPSPSPSAAASPSGKPTAKPPVTTTPAGPTAEELKARQVADLLGQADAAAGAKNYDAAAGLYGQVLGLDPGNAKATEGKAAAQAALAAMKKTFVPGRTSVTGSKQAKGNVSGFDDADVSKAPDYSGRIEFDASPRSVKPGDGYSIKVYLINDGKKAFKIGGLNVATNVNGSPAGTGSGSPPAKAVDPQARVLLQEASGTWGDNVSSWSLDVTVTDDHGDTFKSSLTWR